MTTSTVLVLMLSPKQGREFHTARKNEVAIPFNFIVETKSHRSVDGSLKVTSLNNKLIYPDFSNIFLGIYFGYMFVFNYSLILHISRFRVSGWRV